jgi:hypothetical protein
MHAEDMRAAVQGSAPAFNNAGNPLLHAPGAVQPGAPFGGHLDAAGGSEYLIGQSDQARLMASVSNSPGALRPPHRLCIHVHSSAAVM